MSSLSEFYRFPFFRDNRLLSKRFEQLRLLRVDRYHASGLHALNHFLQIRARRMTRRVDLVIINAVQSQPVAQDAVLYLQRLAPGRG